MRLPGRARDPIERKFSHWFSLLMTLAVVRFTRVKLDSRFMTRLLDRQWIPDRVECRTVSFFDQRRFRVAERPSAV